MHRRCFLYLVVVLCTAAAAPPTRPAPTLGEKIVLFCRRQVGKTVGNGECAILARDALKAVDAKGRRPDNPEKDDYVWGDLVLLAQPSNGGVKFENGQPRNLRPGDIIQFRNAHFAGGDNHVRYSMSCPHHTAIVAGVGDFGMTIHVLQQNVAGEKIVSQGVLHLEDLKTGWLRFYRPVAKDAP